MRTRGFVKGIIILLVMSLVLSFFAFTPQSVFAASGDEYYIDFSNPDNYRSRAVYLDTEHGYLEGDGSFEDPCKDLSTAMSLIEASNGVKDILVFCNTVGFVAGEGLSLTFPEGYNKPIHLVRSVEKNGEDNKVFPFFNPVSNDSNDPNVITMGSLSSFAGEAFDENDTDTSVRFIVEGNVIGANSVKNIAHFVSLKGASQGIQVRNTIFRNFVSENEYDSGIVCATLVSTINFKNVSFKNNSFPLYIDINGDVVSSSAVTIVGAADEAVFNFDNCVFDGNERNKPLCFLPVKNSASNTILNIINCTFANNSANDTTSTIYVNDCANLNISGCTFINNTSGRLNNLTIGVFSAGINIINSTTVNISHCTFDGNSSEIYRSSDSHVGADIDITGSAVIRIEDNVFSNSIVERCDDQSTDDKGSKGAMVSVSMNVNDLSDNSTSNSKIEFVNNTFLSGESSVCGIILRNTLNCEINACDFTGFLDAALYDELYKTDKEGNTVARSIVDSNFVNNKLAIDASCGNYNIVNCLFSGDLSQYENESVDSNEYMSAINMHKKQDVSKTFTPKKLIIMGTRVENYYSQDSALNISDVALVEIRESLFKSNVSAGDGGAISIKNTLNMSKVIKLENNEFNGNMAYGNGGAVDVRQQFSITSVSNTYSHNLATGGGALSLVDAADNGSGISISGDSFIGNYSSSNAGAILLQNYISCEIASSTFSSNTAALCGGAIYASESSYLTILPSSDIVAATVFSENKVGNNYNDYAAGGAIYIMSDRESSISATFVKNESTDGGSAIAIGDGNAKVTISGSIFEQNVINAGGSGDNIGGVVYVTNADIDVIGSSFESNQSYGFGGALAIFYTSAHSANIVNSSFEGNRVETTGDDGNGGAVSFVSSSAQKSTLVVSGINASNNFASQKGGAIYVKNSGIDDIIIGAGTNGQSELSAISGNKAGSVASALYFENISSLTMSDTGIYNHMSESVLPMFSSRSFIVSGLTFRS